MELGNPEVTTVIPTRDREDLLPRTLVSALNQEGVDSEVIVVDDGSLTPVHGLVGSTGRPGVRVLRHGTPSGPPAARNTGLSQARGRWVAFLDDDDLWAPSKLRRELEVALGAGADFAFCGGVAADRNGTPIWIEDAPPADDDLHRSLLATNVVPFPHSNLLVKTETLRSLGGFDPQLHHLSDWDLLLRLTRAHRSAMTPEVLVGYTVHQTNLHQSDRLLAEELQRFKLKYAAERDEAGVPLDRACWLRWRAGGSRGSGRRFGSAAAYLRLAWLCRDPGLAARGLTLVVGGEWAMRKGRAARLRIARGGGASAPPWLAQAANPSPAAMQAATT